MVQVPRTIDLQELHVFASVARHGGITAAATALGVSKSSVSTLITRLERRLGARLLERNSRRVALTREGEQMLPRIQSILVDAEGLLEEATRATVTPQGTVRMAVPPALGGVLLERLVPVLADRYPNIALVIMPSYDLDNLQDPAFDFAVRVGQVRDESLVASKVGSFARILVSSPDHPAARLSAGGMLDDVSLLAFSGSSTHVDWRLCKADGSGQEIMLDRRARVSVRDFDLLLRLARAGQGVAMVPNFMVRTDFEEGRLVHVLPEWQSPDMDVMLAHRIGSSRVRRVAAVLDETRILLGRLLAGEDITRNAEA